MTLENTRKKYDRKKYDRRIFLKTLGLGAAGAAPVLSGCASLGRILGGSGGAGKTGGPPGGAATNKPEQGDRFGTAEKPNILLIMADDMGFADLGCYGSSIRTPNVDRLAAEGIRFTRFYNAARCCPTRASLLTGLYPHQAGMGGMVSFGGRAKPGPYQGFLNDRCVTIAEVLEEAGYRTLMSGKWHVGEERPHWPVDRGFGRYFGLISGAANYFDITKGKRKGIKRRMALDGAPFHPPREGFYMTDAITEHALSFLDSAGAGEKPFFLYTAYTAPHWPLHAPPEEIERYRGRFMKGWDVLRRERHARQIEAGLVDPRWPLSPRHEKAPAFAEVKDKEGMDLKMAVYAAQIDRMDQGIGRILEKIAALGKKESTLVLFLSDNGGCAEGGTFGFDLRRNGLPPGGVDSYMSYGLSWANASNTPFRFFKQWVHEGGIATPLIACWPEVIKRKGALTHQVGHVVDLMATCLDVAGATYPKEFKGKGIIPLEGSSLLPVLRGQRREGHDALFWEHLGNRAVRKGKWKLVAAKGERWELHDMEADGTELHDLSANHLERVRELAALYDGWAARCGVRKR